MEIDWLELITEDFLSPHSAAIEVADQLVGKYPVALHGVSLSIGSADPLNPSYLAQLQGLISRFDPLIVSDHICWTGVGGQQSHGLLPLPFTEEAVTHIVDRVIQVQEYLNRRIVLENISSYLSYAHSSMSEAVFIAEILNRADCYLLLDVNNLHINATNHHFDPIDYMNTLPPDRVRQYHIAGHQLRPGYLLDTHDRAMNQSGWNLYRHAIKRFGLWPTLLEWDESIPPLEQMVAELEKAKCCAAEVEVSHV